jgi:hypothetical protein
MIHKQSAQLRIRVEKKEDEWFMRHLLRVLARHDKAGKKTSLCNLKT